MDRKNHSGLAKAEVMQPIVGGENAPAASGLLFSIREVIGLGRKPPLDSPMTETHHPHDLCCKKM